VNNLKIRRLFHTVSHPQLLVISLVGTTFYCIGKEVSPILSPPIELPNDLPRPTPKPNRISEAANCTDECQKAKDLKNLRCNRARSCSKGMPPIGILGTEERARYCRAARLKYLRNRACLRARRGVHDACGGGKDKTGRKHGVAEYETYMAELSCWRKIKKACGKP